MLLNANELNTEQIFDYCIVGSGPVGITLALKLASTGKSIALLEGGGETYSNASQGLYKGEVIGDKYFSLDTCRLRYFGGTSNHWAGMCRTLGEEDFQTKGDYAKTEWPIRKSDLDGYLREASSILEIDEIPKDETLGTSGMKQIYFAYSPPVRFATKYRDEIVRSKNISLVLNANVVSFVTSGGLVTSVNIVTPEETQLAVKARIYILAAGGIENSRILLWSNELSGGQLVKSETLGKYWMDHPHFTIGEGLLTGDTALNLDKRGIAFYSPTIETMHENQILNCGLRFFPEPYEGTKKIIADIACVAPRFAHWAGDLLDRELVCGSRVYAAWEQEPNERNRIELSNQKDRFGVPHVTLFWKKSRTDHRTVQVTAETLARYWATNNLGRMRLYDWVLGNDDYPEDGLLAGPHHMGGTRMASSAKDGVVDKNCKAFDQDNLYIAGSSVFPSSGHANPTLTIVQLALRLGDHLSQKVLG